jgi:hypothetical protein
MQYVAAFFGLLLAYTLMYTGFSHFGTPYTVVESST